MAGSTAASGFDIDDPALAESISAGMARVEALLHESVRSEFDFATRTSLHLVDAGGKRFRPLFALLAAQFADPSPDEVITSAAVVEMVHLATLYHDDVMDEAPVRRGAPAAHRLWGNSAAILAGDLIFARASQLMAELGPRPVQIQADTFERLVQGLSLIHISEPTRPY